MRALMIVAAAVALAGCQAAVPVLVAGSADPSNREADVAACRFEGTRAGAGVYHPNAFVAASDRRDAEDRVFRACMLARGYREERHRMSFGAYLNVLNEGR